jgi:hypothetical protein
MRTFSLAESVSVGPEVYCSWEVGFMNYDRNNSFNGVGKVTVATLNNM